MIPVPVELLLLCLISEEQWLLVVIVTVTEKRVFLLCVVVLGMGRIRNEKSWKPTKHGVDVLVGKQGMQEDVDDVCCKCSHDSV